MDFKVGGKGVAFGKVAETDNLVDSAWGIRSGGDVTATANLHIEATATSNPTLFFENENGDRRQFLQYNKANRVARFQCYSQNSGTEEPLGYYETYDLPPIDQDRASNASYNILTTKNTATTGTITPASGWTLASSSYLKKWGGHIVEFNVVLSGGTYINGWNDVATFPVGFVPSISFDFIGVNNGASTQSDLALDCRLSYTGVLRVYKSATITPTNNIVMHGTFIV